MCVCVCIVLSIEDCVHGSTMLCRTHSAPAEQDDCHQFHLHALWICFG